MPIMGSAAEVDVGNRKLENQIKVTCYLYDESLAN